MKNRRRLNLNLASHPLRNRRLFAFLLSFMGILILAMSYLAANLFWETRSQTAAVRASISDLEKRARVAQQEEKKFEAKVEEATKMHKGRVDLINGIILRKSFSWVKLLGNLETALPDSSYILSLAPRLLDDSKMEVKFRVISRNLDNLLELINNLNSLKFSNIRIENEKTDERGLLLSEISLSYERDI